MLIQDLVVESGIANCETGKLSGITVRVLTAGYCRLDQSMLQELLIEVACMSAQISNQVAHLGPDSCIFMANQCIQVNIDVGVVNGFVELFGYPCEL